MLAFLALPVVIAGWNFGKGGGLFAGVLALILSFVMQMADANNTLVQVSRYWLGYILIPVLGFLVGFLQERSSSQEFPVLEVDYRERFVVLLNLATNSITRTGDRAETYYRLVSHITNMFIADYAYLIGLSEQSKQATVLAATSSSIKHIDPMPFEWDEENEIAAAINSGNAKIVNNIQKLSFINNLSQFGDAIQGAKSSLIIPLRTQDFYFGAAVLAYIDPRNFTEDELTYIEIAGNQIALALRAVHQQIEIETQLKEANALAIERAHLYETAQREISERMQAEERFRTLFDFAPEGVLVIDYDNLSFDDVNERAAELFGYTREELIEISPVDVSAPVQPDGRPAIEVIEEVIQSAMAGGSPRLEARYLRSSGEEFPVDVQVVKLPEVDRNLVRVSFTDITEQKLAQEELGRISQEESKRRQELEKLQEISRSMRQAVGSSSLLQVFTEEVQAFCGCDYTSSILFKAPNNLVTCSAAGSTIKLNQKKSKVITKALLSAKNSELAAEYPGFDDALILPLQSADTIYGAVMVASKAPHSYTPDEISMLNAIADMAGTALHRIDFLETLEDRVLQRTRDLVVLYNLITIISENWNLQDLLELSMVLTLETVEADQGIIYLVDEEDPSSLKPIIQRGFAGDFGIEPGSLPDDELARDVFELGKPLAHENLTESAAYAAFDGVNSYVGIPILTRGNVRGVFSLFSKEKGIFGNHEIALLSSIADHLGIGIENSFLLEKSHENVALEERNRLARNLHDSVSQLLYSLTLMAGSTKKMLEHNEDLEDIKTSVTRFGDTAHQALKEMRLLLYELRPAVLESEGLVNAIQHRIETVEERLGLKVDLNDKSLPDLPNNVEDTLYHIALEALNNIVKHSDSTTATIKLTEKKGQIVMEISDNGIGFDITETHKGLGLRNMRERGQMLGGKVDINSTPGEGTYITVTVKMAPSSSKVT